MELARCGRRRTVHRENYRVDRERKHHIQEEEEEWFPKVREGLGRKAFQEIGAEMQAKKKAPRRPNSRVP